MEWYIKDASSSITENHRGGILIYGYTKTGENDKWAIDARSLTEDKYTLLKNRLYSLCRNGIFLRCFHQAANEFGLESIQVKRKLLHYPYAENCSDLEI